MDRGDEQVAGSDGSRRDEGFVSRLFLSFLSFLSIPRLWLITSSLHLSFTPTETLDMLSEYCRFVSTLFLPLSSSLASFADFPFFPFLDLHQRIPHPRRRRRGSLPGY